MKAIFATLDGHAAIYWLGAVAAWVLWIGREWGTSDRDRLRGWRDVGPIFLVLLAWRWPRLFQACGCPVAEAQCIADALAISAPMPEAGGTWLGGSSVMAAAALLPTHFAGVPLDYFNARLVALLMDVASLVGCGVLLERSVRREWSGPGLTAMIAIAAVCDWPLVHAYSSLHLAALLVIAGLASEREAEARLGTPAEALSCAAGVAAGVSIWLEGWGLAGGFMICASVVRRGRQMRWTRAAWFGGGVLLGFGMELALRRGVAALGLDITPWDDVRGLLGDRRDWWIGAAVVAASGATLGLIRTSGAKAQRVAICAFGAVVLVVGVWRGTPPPYGELLQQWREPRGAVALLAAKWRVLPERFLVLAAAPRLAVEMGESADIVRDVWRSDADGAEARRRVLEKLRQWPGAYAVVLPDAMAMVDGFPDFAEDVRNRFRLIANLESLRVYVPAERHWEITRREAAAWYLKSAEFTVPDTGGAANALTPEGNLLTHAPARLLHPVPSGAQALTGAFGFYAGAFLKSDSGTDGATFKVTWILGDGRRLSAIDRHLDPRVRVADRDLVSFDLPVPAERPAQVEFAVDAGANNQFDWTYWTELRFTEQR